MKLVDISLHPIERFGFMADGFPEVTMSICARGHKKPSGVLRLGKA